MYFANLYTCILYSRLCLLLFNIGSQFISFPSFNICLKVVLLLTLTETLNRRENDLEPESEVKDEMTPSHEGRRFILKEL